MLSINADLHIHSRFSISTSKYMTFQTLAQEAPKKGVKLVGSGDCLHPKWFKELKSLTEVDEGTFELNNTRFIPTVEVQGKGRVHHLILFPDLSAVEQFREGIKKISKNLTTDGRPTVPLSGNEIAQMALDVDGVFGPCHAFTPWTGLYGYFDSLSDCYGDLSRKVAFLELGLSADSNYADRIKELNVLTFLSNSDAHSPYPLRLAREFNQFEVNDATFQEIRKAILRQGGRMCKLNVGLPPEEGKYNLSACSRCFTVYPLDKCINQEWTCTCGGRIKKGVVDRINELAAQDIPGKPKHRSEYVHVIPLAEIIAKAMDITNVNSKKVQTAWEKLIDHFNDEINILLKSDIQEIERVSEPKIALAIKYFRENKIILHPGGGGRYGTIELPPLE